MSELPESFRLAALGEGVASRSARWAAEGRLGALARKSPALWPGYEGPDRLGWLDLPQSSSPVAAEASALAGQARSEGVARIVLLGMGGSSLAPEVFDRLFGGLGVGAALSLLDTTHPAAVSRVASELDPDATLVLVASKSGTTVETLSLFRYFWKAIGDGSRFVALTDPGTPLESLARERGFRRLFSTPENVGGRFSALSAFGLVPAALVGADPGALLASGRRAAGELEAGDAALAALGALLVEAARGGRDKLTFVAAPSLEPLSDWLEQLIAESLGKKGMGVVPVVREPLGSIDVYGDDRLFVGLALGRDDDGMQAEFLRAVRRRGHPVVERALSDTHDVAAEMYRWQAAVALAGADLAIDPFDQPDVDLAKVRAKQAMERPGSDPSSAVFGIAEPGLEGRLRRWLAGSAAGDYLFVQAFLDPTSEIETDLRLLQAALRDRSGLAVGAGYGPRFLHSTGQLHKGGPERCAFLQVVDRPAEQIPVPEADFTFARLIAAQAEGDAAALEERGRRILRLDLGSDAAAGLRLLRDILARPEAS